MKTDLRSIGNAKGVIIPKPIIQQCGFGDQVELTVEGNKLVLTPSASPRDGWAKTFETAGQQESLMLPDYLSEDWDDAEWTW